MIPNEIYAESKRCNRCHQQLPKSAFNSNPHFRDGLHGHCRECQEEVVRECEALVEGRNRKMTEKVKNLSADDRERLRLRNLQYRRKYLEKKRSQRTKGQAAS